MKNLIIPFLAICVLTASCKKETTPPVVPPTTTTTTTTTPKDTTTTTPKDTIKVVSPIAAQNTFILSDTTRTFNFNECTTEGSGFYYISGAIGSYLCKIYFKNKPVAKATYTITNKAGSNLGITETAIQINSATSWYSVSGKVYVTISNGKISGFYNNASFADQNDKTKTTISSGNITCN